jgi:RES domain-containing protein
MLEYFVHLDPDDAPDDLLLATADVPAELPRLRLGLEDLPPKWRETPALPELARLGDQFAERGECCILIVPSALSPNENNWLLNPLHPDFANIAIRPAEPLSYDARLFRRLGRRRQHPRQT